MKRVEIEEIVKKNGTQKSALISILQDVQDKYNYLPEEAFKVVSELLIRVSLFAFLPFLSAPSHPAKAPTHKAVIVVSPTNIPIAPISVRPRDTIQTFLILLKGS